MKCMSVFKIKFYDLLYAVNIQFVDISRDLFFMLTHQMSTNWTGIFQVSNQRNVD